MKTNVALAVLLSVLIGVAFQASPGGASVPMTVSELSSAAGTGFWGGLLCGAAAGGTAVGVAAAITAATSGVGSPLAIGIGTSLSAHVFAACMMI